MKIILIDNYDSFSYNLVDLLSKEDYEVKVIRNTVTLEYLNEIIGEDYKSFFLVLSPGPGTPSSAGNLMQIIHTYQGKIPMLGICLGHQALIENAGGRIIKSHEVVHGKSSILLLGEHSIFKDMGESMIIGRYHSLQGSELPLEIEELASYENIPMIIEWKANAMVGIQFHPESIMTPKGSHLLKNIIQYLGAN